MKKKKKNPSKQFPTSWTFRFFLQPVLHHQSKKAMEQYLKTIKKSLPHIKASPHPPPIKSFDLKNVARVWWS